MTALVSRGNIGIEKCSYGMGPFTAGGLKSRKIMGSPEDVHGFLDSGDIQFFSDVPRESSKKCRRGGLVENMIIIDLAGHAVSGMKGIRHRPAVFDDYVCRGEAIQSFF